MMVDNRPDAIIHLAANVHGIKYNIDHPEKMFYDNVMMNTNVLNASLKYGISRVLSALSTCAYPAHMAPYPYNEKRFYSGAPEETNLPYGFAKRCLHVHSCAIRKEHKLNYSTFAPCNVYGINDDFNLETSHFVSALIRKYVEAEDNACLEFYGSGRELRQQIYVDDLAKIIVLLLKMHNSNLPLIVAPTENLAIKEMIELFFNTINNPKNLTYKFNGRLSGQYRKDGSNKELIKLIKKFKFTPFEEGIKETYKWYVNNE